MKLFQILSLCLLSTAKSHSSHPTYEQYSNYRASPRVSYSTSIVHRGLEDQEAESSINVNFEPQKVTYNAHKATTTGVFNQNDPTKNLFNVGYTMSFQTKKPSSNRNIKNQKGVSSMRNHNLENAEVITGITKQNEQVKAPQSDIQMSPQDFVTHALLKQKHLISGIKPKYPLPPDSERYKTSKVVNSGEVKNFSPKIQQHIKSLEKTKAIEIENHKFKNNQENFYNWKNLSPGVEIVKSAEIPYSDNLHKAKTNFEKTVNQKYTVSHYTKPNFDFRGIESEETKNLEKSPFQNSEFLNFDFGSPENSENSYTVQDNKYKPIKSDELEPYLSTEINQLPKVDTTLLREPMLITDLHNIPKDPKIVPIHFDLRPLQAITHQEPLVQSTNNKNTYMHAYVYEDQGKRNYQSSQESLENNQYSNEKENFSDQVNNNVRDTETSQSEHQFSYYGAPDDFTYSEYVSPSFHKPREPRVIKDNKWTPIDTGEKPKFYIKSSDLKEVSSKENKKEVMRYTKVQQSKPKGPPKPEKPKKLYKDKPIVGLRKEPKPSPWEKPWFRGSAHQKYREFNVPSLGYSFF